MKKWKVKHYLSIKRQACEPKDFWKIYPSFDISDSELHSILTNSPQLLCPIKLSTPSLFLKFQANIEERYVSFLGKNFVNNSRIKIYLFLVKYSWILLLSPIPLFSHCLSFPISFTFLIPLSQVLSCRTDCLKTVFTRTIAFHQHWVSALHMVKLFCLHRSGTSLKVKYLFSHSLPQLIDPAHFCWLLIYGLNSPSQHNLHHAESYLCLALIHLMIA